MREGDVMPFNTSNVGNILSDSSGYTEPVNNPFGTLKKKKDEKEEAGEKYNDMILNVLNHLQEAMYPNGRVSQGSGKECHWAIYSADFKSSLVFIILVFDDNNKPIKFVCSCGSNPLHYTTGLLREDLIEVLSQICSP